MESFEHMSKISSKSILTISSYTVSKSVRFLRHSVRSSHRAARSYAELVKHVHNVQSVDKTLRGKVCMYAGRAEPCKILVKRSLTLECRGQKPLPRAVTEIVPCIPLDLVPCGKYEMQRKPPGGPTLRSRQMISASAQLKAPA